MPFSYCLLCQCFDVPLALKSDTFLFGPDGGCIALLLSASRGLRHKLTLHIHATLTVGLERAHIQHARLGVPITPDDQMAVLRNFIAARAVDCARCWCQSL